MKKLLLLVLVVILAASAVSHPILAQKTAAYACDINTPADTDGMPCYPTNPNPTSIPSDEPQGYPHLPNPATGRYIVGTMADPFAEFSRRPLDRFIIPAGGTFMADTRNEPHLGVDYSDPNTYLAGAPVYVHPIGPGYITARASCPLCFVDGDDRGRVEWKRGEYNFGFGVVLLTETPFTPSLSVYVMYAHLNEDFVSLGDYVTPDQIIGVTGNTGYTENNHVHMEVRFGEPGIFWAADFTDPATLALWQATMFVDPARLVFPENHAGFIDYMRNWLAQKKPPAVPHQPDWLP